MWVPVSGPVEGWLSPSRPDTLLKLDWGEVLFMMLLLSLYDRMDRGTETWRAKESRPPFPNESSRSQLNDGDTGRDDRTCCAGRTAVTSTPQDYSAKTGRGQSSRPVLYQLVTAQFTCARKANRAMIAARGRRQLGYHDRRLVNPRRWRWAGSGSDGVEPV